MCMHLSTDLCKSKFREAYVITGPKAVHQWLSDGQTMGTMIVLTYMAFTPVFLEPRDLSAITKMNNIRRAYNGCTNEMLAFHWMVLLITMATDGTENSAQKTYYRQYRQYGCYQGNRSSALFSLKSKKLIIP